MSVDDRELLRTLFPLKVFRIFLFRPYHQFFMKAADNVWDRLSRASLHLLIAHHYQPENCSVTERLSMCEPIRDFWYKSPNQLKHCVEGKGIFETFFRCWLFD
ncbi:hypothetical protein TNCT_468721 [Trichonephila clavata]|uniref:Uncharacterized protein n=1 Tax=Trichonephila clavata TaxID=2740835 RepID=A0A8X6GVV5_TRICU|nr:hypothetical protein TNCT_468721 [Trichonephila clavata]